MCFAGRRRECRRTPVVKITTATQRCGFGQKIDTQRGNNAQYHHVDNQSDGAAARHLKHLYGDESKYAAADQRADLPDQRDTAATYTRRKEFGKERRLRRIAK